MNHAKPDDLMTIYGTPLQSRLFIGSALYPSPHIMKEAF